MALIVNLLALPSAAKGGVIAVCVLAGLTALYGAFRKFSRMSWAGWQLPILFALFLLFDLIPVPAGAAGYVLVVGLGFGMIVLVLGIGALIRGMMRRRTTRAHVGIRVLDHLLGIITAVLDWAVAALVLGGFVLAVCRQIPTESGALSFLDTVYSSAIWQKLGTHAADFLLITILTYSVKAGYKLGIGRFLWVGVSILLSFVAVFGAIYLVLRVPFLISLANKLSALIHLNTIAAWVVGRGLAALIVFLVFFIVIIIINVLINLIFKKVNKVRALNFISGAILAVLFYVFCVAVLTGANFGIHYLAVYADGEGYLAMAGTYAAMVEEVLNSFSLGGLLYRLNPLFSLV